MGETDNRALLERYIAEVWGQGDLGALDRFLADGFRRHVSPGSEPLDRDGQVERLRVIRSAFPDITITLEDAVVEGDRIAFRSTLRGTHRGTLLGISPTGRSVEVGLVDIVRVEGGRFAEQWGGPDMLDLVRQLGASISP